MSMKFRTRALALSSSMLLTCSFIGVQTQGAMAASFYNMTNAFCGVYTHACTKDGNTVIDGRTHVRKSQRVIHAAVGLGCKSSSPDFTSQVFAQDGRDRCKVTFKQAFGGIPFVSVASRADTPDITTYSIPTVIEAGPTYVIVETAQVNNGTFKIYHGGFDLFAVGL
jgi:hypothetical protein